PAVGEARQRRRVAAEERARRIDREALAVAADCAPDLAPALEPEDDGGAVERGVRLGERGRHALKLTRAARVAAAGVGHAALQIRITTLAALAVAVALAHAAAASRRAALVFPAVAVELAWAVAAFAALDADPARRALLGAVAELDRA